MASHPVQIKPRDQPPLPGATAPLAQPPQVSKPITSHNCKAGNITHYPSGSLPYYFRNYDPRRVTKQEAGLEKDHYPNQRGWPPVLPDGTMLAHDVWDTEFNNTDTSIGEFYQNHCTYRQSEVLRIEARGTGLTRWVAIQRLIAAGQLPANFFDDRRYH